MSTPKRERQRQNRLQRMAADEVAAKQYTTRRRIKLIGIAAVVVAAAIAVLAYVQSRDDADVVTTGSELPIEDAAVDLSQADPVPDPETAEADDESPVACPAADGSSPRVVDFDGLQPMCIDPEAQYVAVFNTSEGEMRFELTAAQTPLTVNNFVTLARWGYYDGTLLFRTDPRIDIIQGGSPHTDSASDPGPGYTIPDEPAFDEDPDGRLTGPYRYQPGQLVMARSAGRDSASAQFFLTTGPNTSGLDSQGTYVVFGQTDDAGLAVAQSIIGLHVDAGSMGGAPSRDVTVHSVTIEETPANG